VNWASVALYYAVACAVSWPFFWWRWRSASEFAAWQPPVPKHLFYMLGPAIGAFVALAVFRRTHVRTIGLLGSSIGRSLAFWGVPALLLTVAYAPEFASRGDWGTLPAMFGVGLLAIFGEEMGWRGFLQDALRPLRRARRYLVLGLLWEAWHFTTRWGNGAAFGAVARVTAAAVVVSLLAWLIGEAVDRSRSLLVAVTLHGWFDLAFEAEALLRASPVRAWIVMALSAVVWALLLRTWPTAPRALRSAHREGEPAGSSTQVG